MLTVCIYAALLLPTFEPRLQSTNSLHHRTQHPQKPLFPHETPYSSTVSHRGCLRGRSPLRKDKCEALVPNFIPPSQLTHLLNILPPPSYSSETPSQTPFSSSFTHLRLSPLTSTQLLSPLTSTQLLSPPSNLKSKLPILLLVQHPETFITDVLPNSVSFACSMHVSHSKSAGVSYFRN